MIAYTPVGVSIVTMLLSAVGCASSSVGNGIGDGVAVSVAASTVTVSMKARCITGVNGRGGMSVGAYVTGISRDKVASTVVGWASPAGIPCAISFTVVCAESGYAAMMVD